MPALAMDESEVDHLRRFQAAVDVIHNLPRTGWYRPPHQVMLRFYSLYKQSVFGPCRASRPGFWDPVGRIKWDAWSSLGTMSSDMAMAAYVDEMKKVAQQVIDTVPMNEKTASFFKHFEPLYREIHDMPRPPAFMFQEAGMLGGPRGVEGPGGSEGLSGSGGPEGPGRSEGQAPTSDSENETFCDSVDSVDQQGPEPGSPPGGRHVGAGHGGEGLQVGRGQGPPRSDREPGRKAPPHHSWRERGGPTDSPRRGAPGAGSGGGGGGGSEEGAEQHKARLQQQIVLTLRRLREDMRSVMERLEAMEKLAAAEGPDWRLCRHCAASEQPPEERWWSLDVSSSTLLLFLLWPFAAQFLLLLLKRVQRRRS